MSRDFYDRHVNITDDLAGGDIELPEKIRSGSEDGQRYNLIPTGIMVSNSAAGIAAVKMSLRGDSLESTFYLQHNIPYRLAPGKVIKTGTTTNVILILGEIN